MLPPWGVPLSLHVRVPSSSTPAFSHFWISRTTRRSATRCSILTLKVFSMGFPTNGWSSSSSIQLTFVHTILDDLDQPCREKPIDKNFNGKLAHSTAYSSQ